MFQRFEVTVGACWQETGEVARVFGCLVVDWSSRVPCKTLNEVGFGECLILEAQFTAIF